MSRNGRHRQLHKGINSRTLNAPTQHVTSSRAPHAHVPTQVALELSLQSGVTIDHHLEAIELVGRCALDHLAAQDGHVRLMHVGVGVEGAHDEHARLEAEKLPGPTSMRR